MTVEAGRSLLCSLETWESDTVGLEAGGEEAPLCGRQGHGRPPSTFRPAQWMHEAPALQATWLTPITDSKLTSPRHHFWGGGCL